jgi:hypothetical protein
MALGTLIQLDDARLGRAAAKLTHIGEQTGPVLTVVIAAYTSLPTLGGFRRWHTAGNLYGNDELPQILHFSVTTAELRRLLEAAEQTWQAMSHGSPSLSFTVCADTPEESLGAELLFTQQGGVKLHHALRGALDSTNRIGQIALSRQADAAYVDMP